MADESIPARSAEVTATGWLRRGYQWYCLKGEQCAGSNGGFEDKSLAEVKRDAFAHVAEKGHAVQIDELRSRRYRRYV